MRLGGSPTSRNGVGTATHCIHGSKVRVIQTILDWRPFEYFTYESRRPTSNQADSISTFLLQPAVAGTSVDLRIRVRIHPRWIGVPLYRLLTGAEYRRSLARLSEMANAAAV